MPCYVLEKNGVVVNLYVFPDSAVIHSYLITLFRLCGSVTFSTAFLMLVLRCWRGGGAPARRQ